jgi:hypothetical protein
MDDSNVASSRDPEQRRAVEVAASPASGVALHELPEFRARRIAALPREDRELPGLLDSVDSPVPLL